MMLAGLVAGKALPSVAAAAMAEPACAAISIPFTKLPASNYITGPIYSTVTYEWMPAFYWPANTTPQG
jgi:hypothetical protein